MKIQMRRGLKADLPTLATGEFGFCTDTKELYIGSPEGNVLVNTPTGGPMLLSDLTIDADKDWQGKNITNMGTVEHKGATLKSGVQTEGRATAEMYGTTTCMLHTTQAVFREKMTNTPSSITLSDAPETHEANLASGWPKVDQISKYGFNFLIERNVADVSACSRSKKFVTVGN